MHCVPAFAFYSRRPAGRAPIAGYFCTGLSLSFPHRRGAHWPTGRAMTPDRHIQECLGLEAAWKSKKKSLRNLESKLWQASCVHCPLCCRRGGSMKSHAKYVEFVRRIRFCRSGRRRRRRRTARRGGASLPPVRRRRRKPRYRPASKKGSR